MLHMSVENVLVIQTTGRCGSCGLLHCALLWEDCDTASFQLNPLREGPGGWTRDAPIALCEALYIALIEGRPFPEAPIQARAAAASIKREYRFSKS